MRGSWWFGLVLAACASGSDAGDTDDSDGDTGVVDSADSAEPGDSDTDTADTDDSDTDTGPVGPRFADGDWVDGWGEAVTVDPFANAGRGRVTFALRTEGGGQAVALYLAGMTTSPRTDEDHTMPGAQSSDPERKAWQRVLDCDESPDASSTAFRCDNARDQFSRDSEFLAVGMAAAVWKDKNQVDTMAPDDCIVFGKNPSLLRDDTPPSGLTPPSWVGSDCREVEAGGE